MTQGGSSSPFFASRTDSSRSELDVKFSGEAALISIARRSGRSTCVTKMKRARSLPKPLLLEKAYIQPRRNARLESGMRKKMNTALNGYLRGDTTLVAVEEMQLYCLAHPGSPSAVRRPQLSIRGDLWIALLGPSVKKGIVGIGPSVDAALRAFDAQYLNFPGRATAPKIRNSAYRARDRTAQIQSGFPC
jgi:hypothetical protein